MPKKSGGLLTLLAGVAAGAAAVFLSEKENRVKAKRELKTAVRVAGKLKKDFKTNPKRTVATLEKKGERLVKKTIRTSAAKVAGKKVAAPKTKARKTAKRKAK